MAEEINDLLPFDEGGQDAILGYLLTDRKFFLQALNKIQPIFFAHPYNQKILAKQLDFYATYKRMPTLEEIKTKVFIDENTNDRGKLLVKVGLCIESKKNYTLKFLQDSISQWMHVVIFKEQIPNVLNYFKNRKIKESFNLLAEIDRKRRTVKFDDNGQVDFSNFEEYLQASEQSYKDTLSTGLKVFDEALLDNHGTGGLLKGESTVVLAPFGTGKTLTLITMAKHNIINKKAVLFMTHEGRINDIREKILCSILYCTKKDLFNMYKSSEGRHYIEQATALIKQFFIYYPYNKPGMTIEDVEPIIRRLQEERLSEKGAGFDLLISDYPAKLTTVQASGGKLEKRHIVSYVYEQFQQMALEHNFHSLMAIQANREGSKVNRNFGEDDARPIAGEDVAESFQVIMNMDNVISINRSPQDEANNSIWYYIIKTRSNKKNIVIACKSDFARSTAFSNELSGVSYCGGSLMRRRLEEMLLKYKNTQAPLEFINDPLAI